MKATLVCRSESQRKALKDWLDDQELPIQLEVGSLTITRTDAQNKTIHWIIGWMANTTGENPGELKDELKEELAQGYPTSEMSVGDASEFIERLLALLAQHGFAVQLPIGLLEEAHGDGKDD